MRLKSPEQPGRRGFVHAVVGGGLAGVSATASGTAEPGLPFHAWAPTPSMGC